MQLLDEATTPYPLGLGHEGSGIVEMGEGVKTIEPGDHVVLSFASCGHCENCLTGHPTVCVHTTTLNFGGITADGTYRLYQGDQELSNIFRTILFRHISAHML